MIESVIVSLTVICNPGMEFITTTLYTAKRTELNTIKKR